MVDGWTCSRCSAVNTVTLFSCATCGAPRATTDSAPAAPPSTAPDEPRADDPRPDEATIAAGGIPGWTPPASEPPSGSSPTPGEPTAPATAGSEGWTPPSEWNRAPEAAAAVSGWTAPDGTVASGAGEVGKPPPLWRRIPLGWLVVGVFVLIGAVAGWYFNASRAPTGEITKSGDMQAVDLRVGDCFDLKDPSADTIEDVKAVPCTTEHEFELFFAGPMIDGEYPSDSAFESYVTANCHPAFATYVGKDLETSELDIYWMIPTDDAWRDGDRSVQCAAFHPRVHRLSQSLKGSQQ